MFSNSGCQEILCGFGRFAIHFMNFMCLSAACHLLRFFEQEWRALLRIDCLLGACLGFKSEFSHS